jgi:hypothetical protein
VLVFVVVVCMFSVEQKRVLKKGIEKVLVSAPYPMEKERFEKYVG